jgi:hypothetical protein
MTGAVLDISSRIVCKLSGRKTCRSFRLVISRVFVGGVGCVRGGRLDRSSDSDDLDEARRSNMGLPGDSGEDGEDGEDVPDMIASVRISFLVLRHLLSRVVGGVV